MTWTKNNSPKVSIIVPVYNVENYLQCCIDSLLNQTLKDIEIILVDDGSFDNCPAICDEYAKQDQRVKVIHKQNEGQGYARNTGLEIAFGEYITFVDSDDYTDLDAYEKLYSIAKNTKIDIVFFSCRRFDEQGNIWMDTSAGKEKRYLTIEYIRGLILGMVSSPINVNEQRISSSACCALFRHDLIKTNSIKFKSERDLNGGEDMLFNIDYLMHSSSVIAIPDVFYNYRKNLNSFSNTVKSDSIIRNHLLYQCLLDFFKENNFGMEGFLRATKFFIENSRNDIRRYILLSLSKNEKMLWLKEVSNYTFWKEIASTYPYKQMPLKHALQFYLLYKRRFRLLYYFSLIYSKILK